jgi:hypothetical protein
VNLSQTQKKAFVEAVMADVPKINHDEEIGKIARADLESRVPPEILELSQREHGKYRKFFNHATWRVREGRTRIEKKPGGHRIQLEAAVTGVHVVSEHSGYSALNVSEAAWKKIEPLVNAWDADIVKRNALAERMELTLSRVRTLKQLQEAYPELKKYMPPDQPAYTAMVPATNIIRELMDAGWPKGKTPQSIAAPRNEVPSPSLAAMMGAEAKRDALKTATKKAAKAK